MVTAAVLLTGLAAMLWLVATETGMRWTLARAAAASNGALRWNSAEGTLIGGLQIRGLAWRSDAFSLTLQQLQMQWQPWRLLDATLVLDEVVLSQLVVELVGTNATAEPLTPAALQQLLFALPLPVELKALQVNGLAVQTARSSFALTKLSGALAGDDSRLRLAGVEVQQEGSSISGDVSLSRALEIDAALQWHAVLQQRELAGTLKLEGNLQRLSVQHELITPLALTSSGSVEPGLFGGQTVAIDLQHSAPRQTLATFSQPTLTVGGTLNTRGTPADLAIDGNITLEQPRFAPLTAGLTLQYREGGVVIRTVSLDSSELALTAAGSMQTTPLALTLDWQLSRLQAGDRWPAVKLENAAGSGHVELGAGTNGYDGLLALDAFTGRLNGYPITVKGSATMVDSRPAAVQLLAGSGDNTLDIKGTLAGVPDLQWQLQAPALAQLSSALGGTLQAQGEISGTADAPAFKATLQGNSLALVNGNTRYQLDSAALTLAGTAAAHEFTAAITAPLGSATLEVSGSAAANGWQGTLTEALLNGDYGRWQLQAPAALSFIDGSATVKQQCWAMQDTSVCLQASKPPAQGINGTLALQQFPLEWLNDSAQAPEGKPAALQEMQDEFALNLPMGLRSEGMLDLQLDVRGLQGTQATAVDVVLVPHEVVLQLTRQQMPDTDTPPDIERFALAVNRSELHYAARRWQTDIDVGVADAQRGGVSLGAAHGSITLDDSGTLGGSIAAAFTDLNWLETLVPELSRPSGRLDATLALSGTLNAPLLQGQAQLQDGNVDLPAWGLEVRGAAFTLAPLADGSWQLVGSAVSGAGSVSLLATVREPFAPARSFDAQVRGAGVQVLNTSYAAATLSPDLRLHYGSNAISLEGSLVVDSAAVDLETVFGEAGGNAVPMSGDVTVVSGNALPQTAITGTTVPLTLDLALKLGDAVQVRGYKLDARLAGELRLQQVPGRSLLVYGQLDIPSGSYEIYNQRLNTRDGNLAFFGNPANPSMDLRAFRTTDTAEVGVQLSGNLNNIHGELYSTPLLPANEILALLVTGKTLNAVNAQENTALLGAIASLGLGRGKGIGQGITDRVTSTFGLESLSIGGGDTLEDSALGLGKFLTPDLLMRYKVGLFDRQSMLGIEYTLNEHLKLKVESGISQSVELSYTIEKN